MRYVNLRNGLSKSIKKRDKIRNIITVIMMHVLVTSFLVGCENKTSISGYEDSGTAYYVNEFGKRVSRIYYLEYERPYVFDKRGFAKIEKKVKSSNFNKAKNDEVYFIDKNFNVVGDRFFKYGKAEKYYYNGQDIFVALTENIIEIYDEDMNVISTIPYDPYGLAEDDFIWWIIHEPGDNGFFPIRDKKSEKWGYMDIYGKILIQPKYDVVYPFYEGKAFVRAGDEEVYSIINEKGELIEDNVSAERWESWLENRDTEDNVFSSDIERYILVNKK